MTKITIFRNQDQAFLGFDCLGHAGYAEEGEDIVCAGISALVINTINSLGVYTKEKFSTGITFVGNSKSSKISSIFILLFLI